MGELLKKLVRSAYRSLLPASAKSTLRLYLLLEECDKPPEPVTAFDCGAVVVLAPHMDDEVIGCGGTLRRHALAGCRVTVVFLTDGRRGDPDLYRQDLDPAGLQAREQALAAIRKEESRRAAGILGIAERIHLDAPDGSLAPEPAIVDEITRILAERRPGVVYVPSMLDVHRDHWAANRILAAALDREALRGQRFAVREYEAWTPLLANRVVDIDEVSAAKFQALEAFESQNRHVDYVHTTRGLNMYRSIYRMGGRGYAEAFYESTPAGYRLLFDRFCAKR